MAADDFTLKPNWVEPLEPEYNSVITQTESMKKEYMNISTNPTEKFKLRFLGLSAANFKILFDHYKGRYGGCDSFKWMNAYIPSYLLTLFSLTTEDLNGRWVEKSLKFNADYNSWTAEIIFEKQIS